MAERWKPVPSYPGVLASNRGRILLSPEYAPLPNGGYRTYLPGPITGVVMRANRNAAHEYLGYWTRRHGNMKVHRLVCEAFHGLRPFDGAVVIHLDENALNNRPENLKWGTQKENLNAPGFIEYCKGRVGENHAFKKRRAA